MVNRPLIFFIDPQSYNNLGKYDSKLIAGITNLEKVRIDFYCSTLFEEQVDRTVKILPTFRYQNHSAKLLKVTSYCFSLLKILSDCFLKKPQVIHVQWIKFPLVDCFIYSLVQKLIGTKLVYTSHNVVPHGTDNAKHFWLSKFLYRCDHIIVHHEATKIEVMKRFDLVRHKISVIHHGPIPLHSGKVSKAVDSVRKFCSSKDLVFGFIGSGSFYKGLDILVNAWKRVPIYLREHSVLLLCGKIDTSLEQSLGGMNWHNATEGLIVQNAYLTEPDLDAYVSLMDVVVLPHRKISQSGVLLSVLDREACFVVADHPAFVDVVDKYKLGWVYDGSEAALTKVLISLLMNPEDIVQKKYNAEGRKCANAAVSWGSAALLTTRVYLENATPD